MNPRIVLALVAMSSLALQAFASTLGEVEQAYRSSTVYIVAQKAVQLTGAVTEEGGSGFIVNDKGFVLTAAHVVSGGPGIQVDVRGAVGSSAGYLEPMETLYEDSHIDVAVLRFRNSAIKRNPVVIGDPWKTPPDATVYALGFPKGEEWFFAEGKLSGPGPQGSWNTTSPLNPGMSGGPVFDTQAQVIAMVWGGVPTPGINGINRVLPLYLLESQLRFVGAAATGQPHPLPAQAGAVQEFIYQFNQEQTTLGGMSPGSREYSRTFDAKPGHKIVEFRYASKSANHASEPSISVTPDGKQVKVDFSLTSGPLFDQYRGWIDGTILTKQTPAQ